MTKLHSHIRTWEDKKNLNIKFLLWPLTAPHSALWMCIMHGPDLPNQQEYFSSVQFSPVTQLCPPLCDLMDCSTPGPPCPSPTPGIYSNSCPSSRWCHPTISHIHTHIHRVDWFDLLAVQGTLKNLLQHHSSKASILRHSVVFTVQLSHPYMTTGKTIALTSLQLK